MPWRELCFFLKVTGKCLLKLLQRALQSRSSEKCCEHLEERTRTVSAECSGNLKKENKASGRKKHFRGL